MSTVRRAIAAVGAAVALVAPAVPAAAAVPSPADDPAYVPLSALSPRTSQAYSDRPPVYDNGCHAKGTVTVAKFCVYGQTSGFTRTVVVLGDSHMAQWWYPITSGAKARGWRVLWLTKSACPAADVSVLRWRSTARYPECDEWRRSAVAKIKGLTRVDLLVMSSYSRFVVLDRDTGQPITDYSERRAEWLAGTERTVLRLRWEVRGILVLRDTPQIHRNVPDCLEATGGWTSKCSRSRSSALTLPTWGAERDVDAEYLRVTTKDFADTICSSTACRPVTGDEVLRYRDDNHLTVTYTRWLKPAVMAALEAAMA